MDHLKYYQLQQEPFQIMPVTQFYYHNEQHDQAHLRLMRAVEGMKGLALLVGDVGMGKSLLARRLLETLPDEQYECSLLVVLHSDVDSNWLVRRIAAQFGISSEEGEGKVPVLGRLYERLVQISEEGRRAVVLIDEAHMLKEQTLLEELRGLLNLELPEKKLLSIVLFGMLPLDEVVAREPALAQRVAVRVSLKPLSREVMVDYIRFRLLHAGSTAQIFSVPALERVYAYSGGNPRLVNVICDNALFEGFVRKCALPMPAEVIDSVAEDLRLTAHPTPPAHQPAAHE